MRLPDEILDDKCFVKMVLQLGVGILKLLQILLHIFQHTRRILN